jgi:hypothetical protein
MTYLLGDLTRRRHSTRPTREVERRCVSLLFRAGSFAAPAIAGSATRPSTPPLCLDFNAATVILLPPSVHDLDSYGRARVEVTVKVIRGRVGPAIADMR